MQDMKVRRVMSSEEANDKRRQYLDADSARVVRSTCIVTDADSGAVLAVYLRQHVPEHLTKLAHGMRAWSRGRGDASGPLTENDLTGDEKIVRKDGCNRLRCSDGRMRDKAVESNTVGYNSNGALSYWTKRYAKKASSLKPLLEHMVEAYRRHAPQQYRTQDEKCTLRFLGLPISSIAVNHNFRCGLHQDKNDINNTLGLMMVAGDDMVVGGQLIFPEYGMCFDVRRGDLLMFDSQLYHANAAFTNTCCFHRISLVAYAR